MKYTYEPHLHTRFSSACARSKGSEYIARYIDLGYSGIIVTDHFYHGNTAIPRNLPWKEWVKQFCRGYEEAHNEGLKRNFSVFFGWEETFDSCDDYLVYGLDKQWLLEHSEAKNWSRGDQYRAVKQAGGCVVQAHPFRQHGYIRKVILSAGCVDGVEAANMGNYEASYDALAMRYAQKMGLPALAGTDMHEAYQVKRDQVFGVYFNKKLESISDFVHAIRTNSIGGLCISKDRCTYYGDETVCIPVEVRDKNDRITGKSWKEVI